MSASRLLQDNMQESTTKPVEPKLKRFTFITFKTLRLSKSYICSKTIIVFFLISVSTILILRRQTSLHTKAITTEDIAPDFIVKVNPEEELHPDTWWDGNVETFTRRGNAEYIVPNIVHFVRIGDRHLSFVEVACIRAAWLQQQPEVLMIHCDNCSATLDSPLWHLLEEIPSILLMKMACPTEIFGVKFSSVQHQSDVVRALVLMKYGGIYLDSDTYMVKNINFLRRYEMSLSWPPGDTVGIQILVAHKNSRYLRLWYGSYRHYRPDLWYWNAGDLPTKKFLSVKPDLVHRVTHDFITNEFLVAQVFLKCDESWRNYSAIHLEARHRKRIATSDYKRYGPLRLDTISNYDRNFGQMIRLMLFGTTRLGAKEIKNIKWLSGHPLDYSNHGCS